MICGTLDDGEHRFKGKIACYELPEYMHSLKSGYIMAFDALTSSFTFMPYGGYSGEVTLEAEIMEDSLYASTGVIVSYTCFIFTK